MSKISWPDISFLPINLDILPPAWWFYATIEEKEAFVRALARYLEYCEDNL